MKKIRLWLLALIIFIPLHTLFSQGNNYFATDSVKNIGINLIKGTEIENAQYIRLKVDNQIIQFSPDDIEEYGFKDGTIYKSKTILISGKSIKVFLEQLVHGKITLYYYTEKENTIYFLEKDSTSLVEMTRNKEFRKQLSKMTSDFEWKAEQIQLVDYKRESLSKLISMYNNGINRPMPHLRFGVVAGYSRTTLTIPISMASRRLNEISFSPNSSATLGVFVELPIEMSDLSFYTGVNFLKSGYSANSRTDEYDVDVVINNTSASLPFLLRYTLPTLGWRPFINIGGLYTYHIRNENIIYESTIDQEVVMINGFIEEPLVSKNMLGYSFGIGVLRNLSYKNAVSSELRYNQLVGNENTFNKSQLDLLFSFSF